MAEYLGGDYNQIQRIEPDDLDNGWMEGTLINVVVVNDELTIDFPTWNDVFDSTTTWREVLE